MVQVRRVHDVLVGQGRVGAANDADDIGAGDVAVLAALGERDLDAQRPGHGRALFRRVQRLLESHRRQLENIRRHRFVDQRAAFQLFVVAVDMARQVYPGHARGDTRVKGDHVPAVALLV